MYRFFLILWLENENRIRRNCHEKQNWICSTFETEYKDMEAPEKKEPICTVPKKSLVDVHFPQNSRTLTYFNDQFDLQIGDIVFVDGALEGISGQVKALQYNFKIKPDAYKKVISVADTDIHGELYLAGSHLVTFDPQVLPYEKAATWFMPPQEEYLISTDDQTFYMDDFESMPFTGKIMDRGHAYYMENKVVYLSVAEHMGKAIVVGSHPYEVEFEYEEGTIQKLTCTCPYCCNCKHQFAAVLQLRETMDLILKNYEKLYESTNCFAAVARDALNAFVLCHRETGKITI